MAITANGLIKLGFEPEIDFLLQDDGDGVYIASWISSEAQPSESAITTANGEWNTAYDAQLYARNREVEYFKLNQLELMTDDAANSTTSHATAIGVIKTKWPKNNTGPVE